MNFSLTKDASFLNASEASVIEAAVRTAVMSLLKVFCELNEKRSHCYELKLTEAERENAALKIRLQAAEQELQTLRLISTSSEETLNHNFSSDVPEEPTEEPARLQSSLAIKEECCTENTSEISDVTLKTECEFPEMDNIQIQQCPSAETWRIQHVRTFRSARSNFSQTREKWIAGDVLGGNLKNRECVRRYRERIRADPEKYHAWKEKERLRYQQNRKTINDLSESMKKMKRKAWRDAKRRNRAKKKVQAADAHGVRTADSSFRRRKRIQDLPEPMQKLQREAWREATRRHRARKMAQAALGIAGKKKYNRDLDFGEEGSSLKRTTGDQGLGRGKASDLSASMADKEQIKQTAAKVLGYVEKVSSFASSIDPLFGIVTSLVGVVRKGLVEDETNELDKDFKEIHAKLESISAQNKQTLHQIRIDEINETFGKYEEYIKHQYGAFNTMVDRVRTHPDNADHFMEEFKNIYERDKSDLSLDVFYRGVIGRNSVFGRPLLMTYLEHCDRNRKIMEARCAHLAHLFQIGLMALMAYYAVTEDDEDEVRDKWSQRVIDIQTKMQEVLDECSEPEIQFQTMDDVEIAEDRDKLKRGLVKAMQCVATISSAAAVVNPIFGVAGSLIRVVLHHVDDEEIQTLRREFVSVNRALDEISRQNQSMLLQIKKETLDGQYSHVENNLRNQFRKFMEVVMARPERVESKRDDFEESYANDLGDQNLHTLYDGVMGKPKLFSQPILEVYMTYSKGERRVMERLCTHITYLFCIGLIALMGYAAIIGDDEEGLREEWAQKMEEVQEKMQEVLRKCK
ncbi:hypothetical protein Baya_1657 [Bagarius yarrelli]|uniref:Uncharacterized protein n=1 Tax=Bagarius yarrelli TaxID=175774 RepID=A0A556TLS7_BAGYA|nr:hypothetical protein Baya_1657 [Bagarius yarrelli]